MFECIYSFWFWYMVAGRMPGPYKASIFSARFPGEFQSVTLRRSRLGGTRTIFIIINNTVTHCQSGGFCPYHVNTQRLLTRTKLLPPQMSSPQKAVNLSLAAVCIGSVASTCSHL